MPRDGSLVLSDVRAPKLIEAQRASVQSFLKSVSGALFGESLVRELNESLESLVIQERRPESPVGSPMWTNENRARYDRSRLRYPSDLTDAEWGHVEPQIPPAKHAG